MKKFISLIAAVAMLSSLLVTAVSADYLFPAGPATLTLTGRAATADEISAFTSYLEEDLEEDLPDTHTVYSIDIALGGLGTLVNTNKTSTPTGFLPEQMAIKLDYGSDLSKLLIFAGAIPVKFSGELSLGWQVIKSSTQLTFEYDLSGASARSFTKNKEIADGAVIATATLAINGTAAATFNDESASVQMGVFEGTKDHTGGYRMYKKISAENDTINASATGLNFASATVVPSEVTISGATAGTVGTPVVLSAATTPAVVTNPAVTWTYVGGTAEGGAVSNGSVSATGAGTVIVKATVDGVDSANYTVTFAAAGPILPADILRKDNATPVRKFSAGATLPTLKKDESATLTEDYYATEFETEALDFANYTYAVVAYEEGSEEPHQFEAIGGNLAELLGNIKFFVVIQKQTNPMNPITDIRVKAISAK